MMEKGGKWDKGGEREEGEREEGTRIRCCAIYQLHATQTY